MEYQYAVNTIIEYASLLDNSQRINLNNPHILYLSAFKLQELFQDEQSDLSMSEMAEKATSFAVRTVKNMQSVETKLAHTIRVNKELVKFLSQKYSSNDTLLEILLVKIGMTPEELIRDYDFSEDKIVNVMSKF